MFEDRARHHRLIIITGKMHTSRNIQSPFTLPLPLPHTTSRNINSLVKGGMFIIVAGTSFADCMLSGFAFSGGAYAVYIRTTNVSQKCSLGSTVNLCFMPVSR